MTPHYGEMARLTDLSEDQVARSPELIAVETARRFNAVIALKADETVIAGPDGSVSYKINETPFAKADIEQELKTVFAARADKQIFVKGDKGLDFTTIAGVIDDAHRAGIDQVGIITPGSEAGR